MALGSISEFHTGVLKVVLETMQGSLPNWKILEEFGLIFPCHVTLELLPFSCGKLSRFEFVSALSQTSAVAGFPWSQFSVIMPDPFCTYTFQITKKSGHLAGRSGALGSQRRGYSGV